MAYALSLYLMSEGTGAELHVGYEAESVPVVKDILASFGEVDEGGASLDVAQSATPALKASLIDLLKKYNKGAPQLRKLKTFVHALRDDEYFLLLPRKAASTAEKLEFERYLHRLNHPDAGDAGDDWTDAVFGPLLEKYDMASPRTDRKSVIGNTRRADKRCRFCGLTFAEGATFEDEAHAIARAFGNRFLLLGDECDVCNHRFGEEIEPSLVALLGVQRVFLGIQGRGATQIAFTEGKMSHDGGKVNIQARLVSKDGDAMTVALGAGAMMTPVAAYRALVKIALSVIDASHLADLTQTIEWVRDGTHDDRRLPTVATAIVDLPPNPSAQITVYCRKGSDPGLPHLLGEFRLGCFLYVFAVPFSGRDDSDLVGFFDDVAFQEAFRHYAQVGTWNQHDLSGRAEVALSPRIRLNRAGRRPDDGAAPAPSAE